VTDAVPTDPVEAARRLGAAALAGHLGEEHTARSFLSDPDAQVRAAALGALVRMGRATPADAASGLADHDPGARAGTPASSVPHCPAPISQAFSTTPTT
jgi:hypothetical protein